jgi:hypothetical protein
VKTFLTRLLGSGDQPSFTIIPNACPLTGLLKIKKMPIFMPFYEREYSLAKEIMLGHKIAPPRITQGIVRPSRSSQ